MTDLDDLYADQAEDHQCREEEAVDRARHRFLLAEAAAYLLWFNGEPGGHRPGTYTHQLLQAWAYADTDDRERLTSVYPELGWALERARAGEYDLLRHTVDRATEQAA